MFSSVFQKYGFMGYFLKNDTACLPLFLYHVRAGGKGAIGRYSPTYTTITVLQSTAAFSCILLVKKCCITNLRSRVSLGILASLGIITTLLNPF